MVDKKLHSLDGRDVNIEEVAIRSAIQNGLEEKYGDIESVSALDLFKEFGFKEVVFEDLPSDVKERLILAVTNSRRSRFGAPDNDVLRGEDEWNDEIKLVAKDDNSALIFFRDYGNRCKNGLTEKYGDSFKLLTIISWDQLRLRSNGDYEMIPMNHDHNSYEAVQGLAFFEAQAKVASQARSDIRDIEQ